MVSIKDLLTNNSDYKLEAMMILSRLIDKDKSFILTYLDYSLDDETVAKFNSDMTKLRNHIPVEYIIKEKEFMNLPFFIDSGVLIPRPDTEIMVEKAIELIKDKELTILDLCTGSGAIALSLAHYCPNAKIIATDISDKALSVARKNAEKFKLTNVKIVKSDLFKELRGNTFDMILSNPPYIETDTIKSLDLRVRDNEPIEALDGGEDGLEFYRAIAENAGAFLKHNGVLIVEIGWNQRGKVMKIFEDKGFTDIDVIKDLSGKYRVITCKKKEP